MKNPVIADNKPVKVELTEGESERAYFCTCGKSKTNRFVMVLMQNGLQNQRVSWPRNRRRLPVPL